MAATTGTCFVGAEIGRGISGQRRHADDRQAGRDANAARGDDADPQAGEAAGSRRHHDTVEIAKADAGCFITRARSGISASAWPRIMAKLSLRDEFRHRPVSSTAAEQAPSAVSMASTRMEDHISADARRDQRRNYIGRTSVTSGTKWRNKFWMPWRSVAVDDGQPEQAPFMLR